MKALKSAGLWALALLLFGCTVRVHDDCDDDDDDDCSTQPPISSPTSYPTGSGVVYSATPTSVTPPSVSSSGSTAASPDGYCLDDGLCAAGKGCDSSGACVALVTNCPLTDACLADPPGFTPTAQWQGQDPTFVGFLGLGVDSWRITVNLDFYPDHVYGEGTAYDTTLRTTRPILITGSRQKGELIGQIAPVNGQRDLDVTFKATMNSASEIKGTATFLSKTGQTERALLFQRTSPCGCATDSCITQSDCSAGQNCVNSKCVTPVVPECAATCECPSGTECSSGKCVPRVQTVRTCSTDCDCDLDAGERCKTGICTVSAVTHGVGGTSGSGGSSGSGGKSASGGTNS